MKYIAITLAVILVLLLVAFVVGGKYASYSKYDPWEDVQRWRVENNKQPYIKSQVLCELADSRTYQLEKNWSHKGFAEGNANIREFTTFSENLTMDTAKSDVLTAWLNSKPHKEVLESERTFGCLVCKSKFCVLELAK